MKTIPLAERHTIETVAELKCRLLDALVAGVPVRIDAAEVSRIDTASLQVLAAFCREADQAEIVEPSDGFLRAARLLGLRRVLGI